MFKAIWAGDTNPPVQFVFFMSKAQVWSLTSDHGNRIKIQPQICLKPFSVCVCVCVCPRPSATSLRSQNLLPNLPNCTGWTQTSLEGQPHCKRLETLKHGKVKVVKLDEILHVDVYYVCMYVNYVNYVNYVYYVYYVYYVCMYVCMYVRTYVCMYVCMYTVCCESSPIKQKGEVGAAPSKRPYQHASED